MLIINKEKRKKIEKRIHNYIWKDVPTSLFDFDQIILYVDAKMFLYSIKDFKKDHFKYINQDQNKFQTNLSTNEN